MDTIGLIAAMPSESDALLRLIPVWTKRTLGSFRGAQFQAGGRECILVTSGMGVRRAGQAARALIDAVHPTCLISFGIAGAVRDDLMIGDVVMGARTCSLRAGTINSSQPLAVLSSQAWEAAEKALVSSGARLVTGTAVTTRGAQLAPEASAGLDNPVMEMETSGVLETAREDRLPLLVLRAISDGPQSPIPFDLEAVMDDEYNYRVGKLLVSLLRHPRLLLEARTMLRNGRTAADNAAAAVLACLEQPGPLTG